MTEKQDCMGYDPYRHFKVSVGGFARDRRKKAFSEGLSAS
jgi:hypothetical protein